MDDAYKRAVSINNAHRVEFFFMMLWVAFDVVLRFERI